MNFRQKIKDQVEQIKRNVNQTFEEEDENLQDQEMINRQQPKKKQDDLDGEQKKYKFGQFSRFAIKHEKKDTNKQIDISQIIRQAIASHLTAVKQFVQTQNQLKTKSQNNVNQFNFLFSNKVTQWPTIIEINRFIQHPIDYTIDEALKLSHFDIEEIVQTFSKRILKCHEIAIIQGKMIKFNQIKTQQYIQQNNKIYYPTSYQNIYVSIGQSKIPILNYFDGVDMMTKQELLKMKPQDRDRIINMVVKFCKSKNMIIQNEIIQKKISEIVNEIISQAS